MRIGIRVALTVMEIIVVKAHVGRWSEDCPEHQGCVVYSMADIPLGFGVVGVSLMFPFFALRRSGR